MTKTKGHILFVYYSHSGQTREVVKAFSEQFVAWGYDVFQSTIHPEENLPFPWSRERFFGIFPGTVLKRPQPFSLIPEPPAEVSWSLIVLAFPPWFLSPARPFHSFLVSGWLEQIGKDIPVITLLTCRNMWVAAMNDVKEILGNRLKAFGVFPDPYPNLVSLFSTLRFLLKGQKRLFGTWGPTAGFSLDKNTQKIKRMADTVNQALYSENWDNLHQEWKRIGLVPVKPALLLMERRGRRNFMRFAHYITSAADEAERRRRIRLLARLLPVAVVVLSPITFIVTLLQGLLHGRELKKICEEAASLNPLPKGAFAAPPQATEL